MIVLPHLSQIKSLSQYLQLRACSELAAGQSELALADVKLMFYISDSLKQEPFLISQLVRIACIQITLQPVWEGLADHRWSDIQLKEIQTRLEQFDISADFKLPIESERASGLVLAKTMREKGLVEIQRIMSEGRATPPGGEIWVARLVSLIVPRGWYYMEQANFCKFHQQQMEGFINATQKNVPSGEMKSRTELDRLMSSSPLSKIFHHCLMASMLVPSLEKMPAKTGSTQTAANEAALACALERFRLAKGSFPETLESLEPQFISQVPNDVVTGDPYKYSRSRSDAFVLYSVGWNKRDDDGLPGKTLFDINQGDWVWRYPVK